jgi:hypothetical protein
MRTFLIAVTALLATWPLPAHSANRNYGVAGFTKIRVEGPYKVTVKTGVAPFAKASGSPAALDRVQVDMRGDTLVVHSNSGAAWGGYPGAASGPAEIFIGTHELSRASVTGAGTISIDRVEGLSFALSLQGSGAGEIGKVESDQINVSLVGTASAKLGGRARKMTALVRGVSALDSAAMTVPHAHISADGTATVDANVTETARVDASGPATIRLTGQPSCTLKVSGAATVSGCK